MKKILALLEQKVEWLVLLAGLAFAGYITWAYIINSPAVVQIGAEKFGTGDVDKAIYEGPASKLDAEMHSTAAHTSITPRHYVDEFRDAMNYAKAPAPTTAPGTSALVLWPQTPPIKFSDMPTLPGNPGMASSGPGETAPGSARGDVAQLPQVPTPQLVATSSDLAYVAMPGQQPNAAPAPNGNGANPAPAGANPVSTVGMDRTYASVLFTIDAAALAKDWDQVHLPASNINTVFVQVQLERQELQPNGSWSDPVQIPPLALGDNAPPVPATGKAGSDALGYINWATSHQKDILQPAFYTVLKGKKWVPPGTDAVMVQTEVKFDPTKYLDPKADVSKLTMEERQKVSAARTKKNQDAARSRRSAPAPSSPGDTAPAAPGGAPAIDEGPNDPDRPANFVAADPVAADNAGTPAIPTPAGPSSKQSPSRAAGGTPPLAQLISYPIPTADFDPGKWGDDHAAQPLFVGWAHDETVQAGHTYRYRVSYRLKNPVLFANSAVKDSKLAEQFDLRSSPSEWSANVEVRAAVNFWLVSASDTSGVATVDVFRWQGGDAKRKTFKVSAGDSIGGKEGTIDFGTGWTIVDMRNDPRTGKVYVILMDPSGSLSRRDVDADSTNPNYIELKQQSTTALR